MPRSIECRYPGLPGRLPRLPTMLAPKGVAPQIRPAISPSVSLIGLPTALRVHRRRYADFGQALRLGQARTVVGEGVAGRLGVGVEMAVEIERSFIYMSPTDKLEQTAIHEAG